MWYPLLLLMVCTNITEYNGILLLCQPIQMIGMKVSQEGDSCILCIVNLELARLRINNTDHTTPKAKDQRLFSDWMALLRESDCE